MGLSTRELVQCLAAPVVGARPITDIVEFGTLYMLRNHTHLDVKSEYILEKDPQKVRDSLRQQYE